MELSKHFETVMDFRTKGRCLHELSDILIIVLCGILADCSDFTEIEDYAREKEVFFGRISASGYRTASLRMTLCGV